jgi:hypothetical protein
VKRGLHACAGAIQTIMQLLRKPETCSAAITMLGKTVELCADKVRLSEGCLIAKLPSSYAGYSAISTNYCRCWD